jgi:hypothetical protein
MNDEALQDLLKRAGEISKAVPEALREAAFNRAVDVLLAGVHPSGQRSAEPSLLRTKRSQDEAVEGVQAPGDHLLANLDRTRYPEVSSVSRVLDRALYLLRIARNDFDIDGLGAADIARVLTDKFRLRASRQAVQQALDGARTYVDKVTTGGRTSYRIMNPGERYLDSLDSQEITKDQKEPAPKRSSRRTSKRSRANASADDPTSKKSQRKSYQGRPGPRVALNQLLDDGYFDSARRIAEIQQHLEHSRAHRYKVSELSPTLVRMVRDPKGLDRNRASDGQYEYTRKANPR